MSSSISADEIVVGAGLTGLVYANVAAALGRRVVVLEKHTKPGGYATNFKRKREFVFDCSLHKITGLGTKGNLSDALSRAGLLEIIEFHPYQELTTFFVGERKMILSANGSEFAEQLFAEFPHQANALDKLFSDINSHGYQNYMLARMALGEYQLNPELLLESKALSKQTTYRYISSLFDDRDLITLFCALAINLGVEAYEADALYFLHFAYTFLNTDKGYVKGSSQSLSDMLAEELGRRGGTLLVREEVTEIKMAQGAIRGCKTRRYDINAEHVVFTGCPHQIQQLLPDRCASTGYSDKLAKLEFGLGSFIVYLGLDVPPHDCGFNQPDYLIGDPDYQRDAEQARYTDLRYQRWPLSISNYHALDPNYGNVIQLEILDQQADWFELDRQDYKNRKKHIAEKIIERASAYFPKLRQHIKYMDISTPRTNHKFTNSGGGSSFGYKPLPKRNMRFLKKPPVEGLKFVGTWINGAGYEPAMCLGFTAATLHSRNSNQ